MISLDVSEVTMVDIDEFCEYDKVSELDWAEYQFVTIEYDYKIHPSASEAIRAIFKQLYDGRKRDE